MKKLIDLYFLYGAVTHKPSCEATDPESGNILAYVTRDNWMEAKAAAIRESVKHIAAGPPPSAEMVEIEIPDPQYPQHPQHPQHPQIIELAEQMLREKMVEK